MGAKFWLLIELRDFSMLTHFALPSSLFLHYPHGDNLTLNGITGYGYLDQQYFSKLAITEENCFKDVSCVL